MLAVALWLTLAQAPAQKIAVVPSANLGVPPKRAAELMKSFVELVRSEGLEPFEAHPCDGRACVIAAAKEAHATAAVSIAFAAVGKDTIIDLECLAEDGKSLDQTTFTVRGGETKLTIEASSFINEVKRKLPQPSTSQPPPPHDGQSVSTLDPPAQPPESIEATHLRSRVIGISAAVAAALAGGGSLAFAIVSQNQLKAFPARAANPDDWLAPRDIQRRNLTLAWVTCGVAAALAATAIYFLFIAD